MFERVDKDKFLIKQFMEWVEIVSGDEVLFSKEFDSGCMIKIFYKKKLNV